MHPPASTTKHCYYHRDVVSLAEMARQKGMKILAITDFELSPVSRIADECVYLPGMGDNFRVSIGPVFVIAQHLINEIAAALGRSPPNHGGADVDGPGPSP